MFDGGTRSRILVLVGVAVVLAGGAALWVTIDPGDTEFGTVDETDSPTPSPTPLGTPTPRPDGDAAIETRFAATLETANIEVRYVDHGSDTFEVGYVSARTDPDGFSWEIGYVAGAYGVVVDEGFGGSSMEITVYSPTGGVIATYTVEGAWAEAFMLGTMTEEEYFERIVDTFGDDPRDDAV